MSQGTCVFIFTRPLQYVNCREIVYNNPQGSRNILLIDANFNEVESFVEHVALNEVSWTEIIIIQSRFHLLKTLASIRIDILYLNSDLGFYFFASICSMSKKTYVYEEGWGTYNNQISKNDSKINNLKISLYKLLGSGNHMGGSKQTDGVLVYNSYLYRQEFPSYNKEIINFNSTFIQALSNASDFFEDLYGYREDIEKFQNQSIAIYATGWKFESIILDQIIKSDKYDSILLKLHPHIKEFENYSGDILVLKQNVLLELYLMGLLENGNKITVFHDNSFSILYFLGSIETVNIGRKRIEYDKINQLFLEI